MTNPSMLHDPMAKLFFPDAPIVPQLRSAAEFDERNPDRFGYGWTSLLNAAADTIETLEEMMKEGKFEGAPYPYIWWHEAQNLWWISTENGSRVIGSFAKAIQVLREELCRTKNKPGTTSSENGEETDQTNTSP